VDVEFSSNFRLFCLLLRCENCVENKFSKGIGYCPTCKSELKKSGFRYQIFEDPFVELEIDIRKRILKE
jgi:CDK-activating kinase assembly factor MAT1